MVLDYLREIMIKIGSLVDDLYREMREKKKGKLEMSQKTKKKWGHLKECNVALDTNGKER